MASSQSVSPLAKLQPDGEPGRSSTSSARRVARVDGVTRGPVDASAGVEECRPSPLRLAYSPSRRLSCRRAKMRPRPRPRRLRKPLRRRLLPRRREKRVRRRRHRSRPPRVRKARLPPHRRRHCLGASAGSFVSVSERARGDDGGARSKCTYSLTTSLESAWILA